MKFELKDEELESVAGGYQESDYPVQPGQFFCEKGDENTVDPGLIYYAKRFETNNGVLYIRGKMLWLNSDRNMYQSAGCSGCFEPHEIAPAQLSGKYELYY